MVFLEENYRKPPSSRYNFILARDSELKRRCRFTLGDLQQIAVRLSLPRSLEQGGDFIRTPNKYKFQGFELLFILCTRLSYPARFEDLANEIHYSKSMISDATNYALEFIHEKWEFLLKDVESGHLTEERVKLMARQVHLNGAPLTNCWGFIDCTIRDICTPIQFQREVYSGYKKKHSLKYSAVKAADGLIYHLYGPFEGRRNDNHLLRASGLLDRLVVWLSISRLIV